MAQVKVTLKSGRTIKVRRDEVQGLRNAKVLDESKLSDELKKPLKKNGDGVKAIGKASLGNILKKAKKSLVEVGYVKVELKSGQTIKVKRHEIEGLVEAGVVKYATTEKKAEKEAKKLADKEAKEKEEKDKAKTKEEKDTGKTKDDSK